MCTSLRMATRSINRLYDRALAAVGMRVTGYSILSRLADEGPMSVSHLARRLGMERTTCTREAAPLIDAGLVDMVPGSDRRRRVLRLTELGARKRAQAFPLWKDVQQRLADDFGGTDIDALLERLHRLQASGDRLSPP
ncbi:transcriptional regulator [Mangrovihabitans endophyticus]|uniref:Transcriptional regulator n=1 Tax=Mangrovihabitans endophyticus TaxID=1751298 RepID=A0A8J3C473_9ACTN|nr:transcriptional regulator [Mangrovihabitans endophyticus]